jgi:glycosyltransferase involved in cell wall biosynthesis
MTDAIRVAIVHGGADPTLDGVADYVDHLVAALPAAGVRAVPVAFRSLADVRRRVRQLDPDLVHVQFAPSAYGFTPAPGLLPLAAGGRALVTTVHEYGWWAWPGWLPDAVWRVVERRGWWDRETGRSLVAGSGVAVTNPAHELLVRQRLGLPVRIIPLAPNVSRCVPGGSDDDGSVLAFFGYVHPVKGVRYLIEAVAMLAGSHPRLRLVVVGGFTSRALPEAEARRFRDELVAVADEHGVTDRVEFTGYLPAAAVSARLAGADVAVLPFTEGVTTKSGALLTVFAHGLPTVATVANEPDPDLSDRVCAVPARRDARALAEAIDAVLGDRGLAERLGAAGARFAADRSWDRVAGEHRRWYEEVLGRHG